MRSRHVILAIAALAAATCTPAGTAQARSTVPDPSFWFVATPDMTFSEVVADAAELGAPEAVATTITAMRQHRAEGFRVLVPDRGREVALTDVGARQALSSARGEGEAVTTTTSRSSAASGTIAAAALDTNNPNTWPVRGSKGSGSLYWSGTFLEIGGGYCNMNGCTTTDKIRTQSVVTNPGAVTSKMSTTLVYSPNSRNFTNVFTRTWNMCDGATKCGNTDKPGTGSLVWYSTNGTRQNGRFLYHGHQLFGTFVPLNGKRTDQATTGNARCEAASVGNACRYS